jgi:RNA polymerase sigma factor (sigma-70 family)
VRAPANPEYGRRGFPSTKWTLIRNAQLDADGRRKALDELLCLYWKPLFFFAMSRGLDRAQAEDAVQGFALQLIEKEHFIERLDPAHGRLRSFLKSAFRNYLVNLGEHALAKKRGGAYRIVSLEMAAADHVAELDAPDPDRVFELEWANTVMERALQVLRRELAEGKRGGSFAVVEAFFAAGSAPSYRELAERFQLTIPQLKSFLHRARARLRELVRDEVVMTVESADDAEQEVTLLVGVLDP